MSKAKSPSQLYRYLLKCIRTLPKGSQSYYKNYVRQVSRPTKSASSFKIVQNVQWRIQDFRKGGGGAFFFFAFQQKGGGVILQKKNPQPTNHLSVFNSARILSKHTLRNSRERGGGLGVLPQKIFKKIGTKSRAILNTSDRHFVQYIFCNCTHATGGYITVHLRIMYNLIAVIKWLIFEKPGIL